MGIEQPTRPAVGAERPPDAAPGNLRTAQHREVWGGGLKNGVLLYDRLDHRRR
jgi:hypothetical protein